MCYIGKKTLAKKYFDDYICSQFDKHAWHTIFEEYNERQMPHEVVSTITGSNQEMSDDQLMRIVRSRILLTTQLLYVADYAIYPDFPPHKKLGKHIVLQCRGLPLSIVFVAKFLGQMDPTYDNL
ncbi:hypothetical protein H5410_022004 [Solanum commersonii]|uniref:Uncharacterized protein n=1 Tax=Solanum commersonii TaxID=4109 RepID=A0A9J5ZCN7_SOLCO|nr:hypothetical protein H5410_022004 [Solanum commersonii]